VRAIPEGSHVAIGQSLANGNVPPQVPYAVGAPLGYHWFADLHGAIASLSSGLPLIPVFFASSALLAGALALVTYELAQRLTGSRRVAAIATILLVLGGGLGWLRLPIDLFTGARDLGKLISTVPYDNVWTDAYPRFRIASVFGTGLLAHRASTFGLPGVITVVLLVEASLGRSRAGMLTAGLLAALLAPFQFYFFPATYVIVLLLVITRRAWRTPGWLVDAALFVGPVVLAASYVIGPALRQSQRGSFKFVLGWSEATAGEGGLPSIVQFYLLNLGVPTVLALVALVRRGTPRRAFLGAWMLALFAIPNLIVASAVPFDMNKYFQLMSVPVAILAATLIARWPRPILAGVLAVSIASPVLIAAWQVTSRQMVLTSAQERAANWMRGNVPPLAVFLTDAWLNSPVDLAGRLRITSFGPYVDNLGFDSVARGADVKNAYCGGDQAASDVMDRYGATYVQSYGGLLECPDGKPGTDFGASALFETVYQDEGLTVWQRR
jgi:hypothetical protein